LRKDATRNHMLSFSSILSAVRPKDRSDRFVVLAAMYCLGAYQAPVTAKVVKDLLRLHLQSKAPTNVNACLRQYQAHVEPAEEGPPLKWSLLPEGVEELRTISGLVLATEALGTGAGYDYDIGIVCALEQPEFEAVQSALGGPSAWHEVGSKNYPHIYRETCLLTIAQKRLRIVATTSTSMGLTAAAIATTHLVLQFRPRLVVMIGIAAGTTAGGKQFGDVLVADPSVDYMSGKFVSIEGTRQFLPDPYPLGLHPRVRSVLRRHVASRPTFANIQSRWTGQLPPGPNKLHLGPLGAADQVIDDHSRILEIQLNWRKLIGLEMETYGVYRACLESPEPKPQALSFKSVCDFAAVKSDEWQEYAAFVAAQFAIEFLRIEWDALWPS
jgi:nucleoside phosphorylase